jgi:hypothetical protein
VPSTEPLINDERSEDEVDKEDIDGDRSDGTGTEGLECLSSSAKTNQTPQLSLSTNKAGCGLSISVSSDVPFELVGNGASRFGFGGGFGFRFPQHFMHNVLSR